MKPPDPPKKEPADEIAVSKAGEAEALVSVAGMNINTPSPAACQTKSAKFEPLEIEHLLDEDERRGPAQTRKGSEISRLMGILDGIGKDGLL